MARAFATKDEVLVIAPALPDNDQLSAIIVSTQNLIRLNEWGDAASEGHKYIAAHFGTLLLTPSAVAGPVTSRKIDKISETYLATAIGDGELSQTSFGRLYMMLRDNLRLQRSSSSGVTPPGWALPDERVH